MLPAGGLGKHQDESSSSFAGDVGGLRLPTCVRNTHIPGWDVAKSCFPGMQTWGREDAKTIEARGEEGERDQKNAVVRSETLRLGRRPCVGVSLLESVFVMWGLRVLYAERKVKN